MEKILIVDDEKVVRKLLRKILKDARYECRTAENVESAKKSLENEKFDLMVTDFNLPDESGAVLSRFVKENYPATAIVMVTVVDNPDQARQILNIGVYGYVLKPFTKNMVLITVENALRRNRLELQLQAYNTILEREIANRTEKLREQLIFSQTLSDAIPAPLYYKDLQNVYQGCNKAFAEFFGKRPEEIIGKKTVEILGEHQVRQYDVKDAELLASGKSQVFETTLADASDSVHEMLFHRATYRNGYGDTVGIVGVLIDITERKKAEEMLYSSEEKLRTIMDSLHIGVLMVNTELEIVQMNRQMLLWFPDTRLEIERGCHKVLGKEDNPNTCADNCLSRKVFLDGSPHEAYYRMSTALGNRDFRVHSSPIFGSLNNEVVATIELFEDVTEKIAVEQELRQAQKLEAIGSLAAGIAHEINTPTQYIGDNVRFLEEAFSDISKVLELYGHLLSTNMNGGSASTIVTDLQSAVKKIELDYLIAEIPDTIKQTLEGVQRVSDIVRAMREFSHPGSDEKISVDINNTLKSTLIVSRNEWKYVADVIENYEEGLPSVLGLPSELSQVFLNIIVNAAHAIGEMPGSETNKGTIEVSTRVEAGAILITFNDSGPGIPEAIRQRVFDPFFTTKTIGKGTGQGLAIARSVVVDKHAGELWFESTESKGTTFFIRLPIAG